MTEARSGDTVKVHYTGRLDDGTVFDTSAEKEPLEFKIGAGQLIADFEQAVVGMEPGESKTVMITSDDAYGPHHDEMVLQIARHDLPEGLDPKVDQRLQVRRDSGETFVVTVAAVSAESVTLDANHPLAGKDLTFDIQLMEIA
jgi:peptidylprolyl isomerase